MSFFSLVKHSIHLKLCPVPNCKFFWTHIRICSLCIRSVKFHNISFLSLISCRDEERDKDGRLLSSTQAFNESFDAGSPGDPCASVELKRRRSDSSDSSRARADSALSSASRGVSRQPNVLLSKSFPANANFGGGQQVVPPAPVSGDAVGFPMTMMMMSGEQRRACSSEQSSASLSSQSPSFALSSTSSSSNTSSGANSGPSSLASPELCSLDESPLPSPVPSPPPSPVAQVPGDQLFSSLLQTTV